MSDTYKIEVKTEYHRNGAVTGLCIEHGKKGTHEEYNVVYNGVCSNEYFTMPHFARQKAIDSLVNLN